jgi:hypothetical protein
MTRAGLAALSEKDRQNAKEVKAPLKDYPGK